MNLDKNQLELSAETAPFYRRENVPGLIDFVKAVFQPDVVQMNQMEGMVKEVLEMIDEETQLACPHHGQWWVTPLAYVTGEKECPACAAASRMRAEQKVREQ